jgi:hypothetical protein
MFHDYGVSVGVTFGDAVGESAGEADTTGMGDGETKMILIALSSGTGERTFLPDIRTPTIMDTNTSMPIITVTAASVRFRSSIVLS